MTRSTTLFSLTLLAALAVSCAESGSLPPPGPPAPPPPVPETLPAEQKATAVTPPQRMAPRPAFVTALFRLDGAMRELDVERTTYLVNLLEQNRYPARKAEEFPPELPEGIIEAAQASAQVQKKEEGKKEVFIFGEIRPGEKAQVRLVAVELEGGKHIDNYGNEGPPAVLDDIIHMTMEELLGSVERYLAQKK